MLRPRVHGVDPFHQPFMKQIRGEMGNVRGQRRLLHLRSDLWTLGLSNLKIDIPGQSCLSAIISLKEGGLTCAEQKGPFSCEDEVQLLLRPCIIPDVQVHSLRRSRISQ